MKEIWLEIVLAVIAALSGGGNIFQFMQVRELRRKSSAEAYQAEINSLRTIIDGNVQEIQRLNTNYGELQDKYFKLAEELQDIKTRFRGEPQRKPKQKKQ